MLTTSAEFTYAFGPDAGRYAERVSVSENTIFVDPAGASDAFAAIISLRRSGTPFVLRPIVSHGQAQLAHRVARAVFEERQSFDAARAIFEGLARGGDQVFIGADAMVNVPFYPPAELATLRECVRLADRVLLPSETHRRYLQTCLDCDLANAHIVPVVAADVPTVTPHEFAQHVVVWAPETAAEDLYFFVYALQAFKAPAVFVCRGYLENTPHHFVTRERAAEALRSAAVIVDAALTDPGVALAFAERGYGIAAAATSGAHEWLSGIYTYNPLNFSELIAAVSRARGRRTPKIHPAARARILVGDSQTIRASEPSSAADLTSIILTQHQSQAALLRSLQALARQDYPNFEVLVVDDAGAYSTDVLEPFPFARWVQYNVTGDYMPAVRTGFAQARGRFIGVTAQDEQLYADHISRLVRVLADGSAHVAYANVLLQLNGAHATNEPSSYLSRPEDYLKPHGGLWSSQATLAGLLITKRAFERIHYFAAGTMHTPAKTFVEDLADFFDFVHVDACTSELLWRPREAAVTTIVALDAPPDNALPSRDSKPAMMKHDHEAIRTVPSTILLQPVASR